MIVVGAGGHGLATAYYLAKHHGITDVAVLERGWLGGGNMGRNTTIIRSNYLWDESAAIYEHSLKLWEGLAEELDYDLLFSQRGVLNLAHNLGDVREGVRRVHANRLNGVDAVWLDADGVKEVCPIVDTSAAPRYPVLGATLPAARRDREARPRRLGLRARGGRARRRPDPGLRGHRAAARRRPDRGRRDVARDDPRRPRRARGGGPLVGAGGDGGAAAPGPVAPAAGARVSELLEQVLDCVVMSNAVHVYVSQAHKGELVMGAGIDAYNGYAQRGAST